MGFSGQRPLTSSLGAFPASDIPVWPPNARVKLRAHMHLRSRWWPPQYLMPATHQSAPQALVGFNVR